MITLYQEERRLDRDLFWFYGPGVASACVWPAREIAQLVAVNVGQRLIEQIA